MKTVTRAALDYILQAHPNATVAERDGKTIVSVPMYDMDTDRSWKEEREVVSGPHDTPMGILPVFNVRTGPKFNPDGDAKISPLGHLYRIIGYSPPPKKDDAE